jgi:hypothetical protein
LVGDLPGEALQHSVAKQAQPKAARWSSWRSAAFRSSSPRRTRP